MISQLLRQSCDRGHTISVMTLTLPARHAAHLWQRGVAISRLLSRTYRKLTLSEVLLAVHVRARGDIARTKLVWRSSLH